MNIINEIKELAKKKKKRIVLPEAYDERIIKAANQIIEEHIADITLIGNPEEITQKASQLGLSQIKNASVIDPYSHEKKEEYTELFYSLRKHKGISKEQATKYIEDPLYLGCIMIKNKDADGQVAGADHATGDVLRSAFQVIKTKPGISIVSGSFLMIMNNQEYGHNGLLFFADSGVNVNPNEEQLAEIAISTAHTARSIGHFEPAVALLSFSTKGSADNEIAQKIRKATEIAQKRAPELNIDGELQADAALSEKIAKKKAPDSNVAGKANVLIFPDLNSGNIGYKLTQYLGGGTALGPLLQGIAAPVNDLSRGCSVNDIVNVVAITVNQTED